MDEHMKENHLTEGSISKTLLLFAVPFLIANILQSLYGAVDLWVVGQYCTSKSVAAVSTGTQVTQIVTSLVTGLTLGSTIIIGQYMGSREYELVRQTIGTTLTVFAVVALMLTGLMLGFERPLLELLGTPKESFDLTMQYVAICSLGNIFICGYNAISAILRGYGDSTRPMIFVGFACVLNIILDMVFVKFLGMDVSGTALATVISQGTSMFAVVIYLKRQNFIFDFQWSSFRPVGKLAGQLTDSGRKVILAAADTFRAAAIEQLTQWSHRAGVELIAQQEGSDPAAVIYDAIAASKSRNADVLICDTAGRLHNKKNLMEELKKINRIIDKEYPEAYRETLVVLDGTTGQNALSQARQFMEVADVTGIILTKLDGTANGGVAVAIQSELGLPV